MPHEPDDELHFQLSAAAEFMAEVRASQFLSGGTLRGGIFLAREQRQAIADAIGTSALVQAAKLSMEIDLPMNLLGERFEEMCRRQKIRIDPTMRPAILKLLAAELWANAQYLSAVATDLIPVTTYHGNITAMCADDEFASLRNTPGLFTMAAVGYPSNPFGFLRQGQENIAAINAEEEFAAFRDTPNVVTRAAFDYPSKSRRFLRRVLKDVAAMTDEEEFIGLHSMPSIFLLAATNYPSDPRAFLRKFQQEVAALSTEGEFASLNDVPGVFIGAAAYHPSDPRAFLRGVQRAMVALAAEEEFAILRGTPGVFKEAATRYSADPRRFLRKRMSSPSTDHSR